MDKRVKRRELYAKYAVEMVALSNEFYPVIGEPLVGDRSKYLEKWGEITERYKKLNTWSD